MLPKTNPLTVRSTAAKARRPRLFVERLEPRALLTAIGLFTSSDQHDLRLFESESRAERFGPAIELGRFEVRPGTFLTSATPAGNGFGGSMHANFHSDGPTITRASITLIDIRTLQAIVPFGGGEFGGRVGSIQVSLPPSYFQNQLRTEINEVLSHEPSSVVAGIENTTARGPIGFGPISTGLVGNNSSNRLNADVNDFTAGTNSSLHNKAANAAVSTDPSSHEHSWSESLTRDEQERLRLQPEEENDEGGYLSLETSIDSDLPWTTETLRSVANKEKPSLIARFREDGTRWGATKPERSEIARFGSRELPAAVRIGIRQATDEVFADEGGMIALMADAGSLVISDAPEVGAGESVPISIDRAIGLFQAVELVSTPEESEIFLPLAPSQPQESPKLPAAPEPTVRSEQATAPEPELQTATLQRAAGVPIMAGAVFSLLSTSAAQKEVKQLPRKAR